VIDDARGREALDIRAENVAHGAVRISRISIADAVFDQTYYERSRTHLSLDKDAPIPRPIAPHGEGRIVAIPQVGGVITGTNGTPPDQVSADVLRAARIAALAGLSSRQAQSATPAASK
jgi:hypothetical protein